MTSSTAVSVWWETYRISVPDVLGCIWLQIWRAEFDGI